MTLEQFKKKATKMPDSPGVYFFLDKRKKVLYIGKATSLRDRVRSYFSSDLAQTRGPIIVKMIEQASGLDWRQTDSVLEALLLEANLIKTYKPKANTDLKDDKSFNYVVITKEDFPRVLLVRGKNLETEFPPNKRLHTFGPFPHGLQLKEAMRIIRKIFPYRDTCTPHSGRRCFNAQIGLCPGVCSGEIPRTEYRDIIRRITLLFQGRKRKLLRQLEQDMKKLAKEERFEEASRLRKQLFALTHIQDVSLIKDEYRSMSFTGGHNNRIEAYDAAHLRGSAAVGVMVVIDDGQAQKGDYRKFNIRAAASGDDAGALREVLSRRLGHSEWPLPRLIIVDGAVQQINAAQKVLREAGITIPVIGVVKDKKHRPRGIRGDKVLIAGRERDILLANAEAHRFAISFHRRKLRQEM